jgi:hypothetical protein
MPGVPYMSVIPEFRRVSKQGYIGRLSQKKKKKKKSTTFPSKSTQVFDSSTFKFIHTMPFCL